jgi:hypothetical protein
MKRLILLCATLFVFVFVNSQTLDEIVKKYSAANKYDKLKTLTSIKITQSTSYMGTDQVIEAWMKNPNKVRIVTSIAGQNIVTAFDGEKGYMINPMSGSNDPTEINPSQAKQLADRNMFNNSMETMLKNGSLTLEGEEAVNGKPAYKLKETIEGGIVAHIFIDKVTFLAVKTSSVVNQGGQSMTVDTYPSDYKDNNGLFIPMKTTQSVSGIEIVTTITKLEVNIPMEDSLFKLK